MLSARYFFPILKILEFHLQIFEKNPKISIFTKIRPIRDYLFHEERTDGRTDGHGDLMKLIVTIRNFAKAPRQGDERKKIN
jgi:hypothetical protein